VKILYLTVWDVCPVEIHFKIIIYPFQKHIMTSYLSLKSSVWRNEKDLFSLLKFIPKTFHSFYQNIKTNQNINDPIVSDEEND